MAGTYSNPVYRSSFPDPFVLKHRGEYFAYSTGLASESAAFRVIRSFDLVNWSDVGAALDLDEPRALHYWAPEVTYDNGKFFLYYSVGDEVNMELRVAVSSRPESGFRDAGVKLTQQKFAIDPHVFRDDDGTWWMFYATDFLDHSHIGTGTVVDQMLDPLKLSGDPRPVTRAKYDWQVYDPHRAEKGGVRWHTVEGPFVLKRKYRYFEMFSGGNWRQPGYGVSFAVSDSIDRVSEWDQFSNGTTTFPILATDPEKVVGPGHNSVVRGPSNRELYCVYHEWVNNERVMAIDRMDFAGDRIFVHGPTISAQPAPYRSIVSDGSQVNLLCRSFLCEMTMKASERDERFGFTLLSENGEILFDLDVNADGRFFKIAGPGGMSRKVAVAAGFERFVDHTFGLEVDNRFIDLTLDEVVVPLDVELNGNASSITASAADTHFEITYGFEDLLIDGINYDRGWTVEPGSGRITSVDRSLQIEAYHGGCGIHREVPPGDFELCINLKFSEMDRNRSAFVFAVGQKFALRPDEKGCSLHSGGATMKLPDVCDPSESRQFRFVSIGNKIDVYSESSHLGVLDTEPTERIGFTAVFATVTVDMVRFTML